MSSVIKLFVKAKDVEKEPEELGRELKTFKKLFESLQTLEYHLDSWITLSKQLKLVAVDLGESVETERSVELAQSMEENDESDSALTAVRTKIRLLTDILVQHKLFKKEQVETSKAVRKLESNPTEEETIRAKDSELKLSDMYRELLGSIKFINQQASVPTDQIDDEVVEKHVEYDVTRLVKHELNAFRVSQFDYLLNCQKLIAGNEKQIKLNYDTQKVSFLESSRQAFHDDRLKLLKKTEKIEEKISILRDEKKKSEDSDSSDDESSGIRTGLEVIKLKRDTLKREYEGVQPIVQDMPDLSWSEINDMIEQDKKNKA